MTQTAASRAGNFFMRWALAIVLFIALTSFVESVTNVMYKEQTRYDRYDDSCYQSQNKTEKEKCYAEKQSLYKTYVTKRSATFAGFGLLFLVTSIVLWRSSSVTLNNPAIERGLVLAATILMGHALYEYWYFMDEWSRVIVAGMVSIAVILLSLWAYKIKISKESTDSKQEIQKP